MALLGGGFCGTKDVEKSRRYLQKSFCSSRRVPEAQGRWHCKPLGTESLTPTHTYLAQMCVPGAEPDVEGTCCCKARATWGLYARFESERDALWVHQQFQSFKDWESTWCIGLESSGASSRGHCTRALQRSQSRQRVHMPFTIRHWTLLLPLGTSSPQVVTDVDSVTFSHLAAEYRQCTCTARPWHYVRLQRWT